MRYLTLALLPLLAAAACTTSKSAPPELTGPSVMGLSLTITANPDMLTKDGSSQATIAVVARNENSQPLSGVPLRIETVVEGALADIGRLSAKNVTTGGDGRASVVYTAPEGPVAGNTQEDESVVTVVATPVGTNFSNALPRSVEIRLMPSGEILPPAGRAVARFSFAPTTPSEGQDVAFDGSASVDCPAGVASEEQCLAVGSRSGLTYSWDFGDGTTGSGARVTHRYTKSGAYSVSLTVVNQRGSTGTMTQFVNVGVSAAPTAAFSFSPTNPEVDQSVFFNAGASTAGPGRTIVSYRWTFGDGGTGSGLTVRHRFTKPGTWTVTLTVTDDLGKRGAISQSITLGDALVPTADFVFSPTEPLAGQSVNFDGRLSKPVDGRRITSWKWNFGDGNTASGERVSNTYSTAGTYSVVLTVTDETGASQSVAKEVEVQ
jgi:PKD repeat protein